MHERSRPRSISDCNKNSVKVIKFVSVLKAEISGVDCTAVTPCVEHARCDRKTGQCLCDKDYSVRWDGLCGECFMLGILSLFVGIAQPMVSQCFMLGILS